MTKRQRQQQLVGIQRQAARTTASVTSQDRFQRRLLDSRIRQVERQMIETRSGRKWADMARAFGGERSLRGRVAALRAYARARGLDEIRHAGDVLAARPRTGGARGYEVRVAENAIQLR